MKKHGLILLVAIVFTISANAQIFEYGIKAGVNFGSLPIDDIKDINSTQGAYDLLTGESVRGYQFGIMTRVNVAMVFIQPELYFNAVGGTVEKLVQATGASELLDVQFNRIDVPLLVGVKLGPARLKVGPVGSAILSSRSELIEISSDLETLGNNVTWGYQAGIGLDLLNKLAIDFRYEGSLSQYAQDFTVENLPPFKFDARPRAFILSFGWWF